MSMRERPDGELLWKPSLVLSGVVGTPLIHLGRMGWGSRGILVGGGGCFLTTPDLIQDDVWCGALTLMEVFLGLYNIATVKDASIATNMDFTSWSLQWNVSCIWLVHNWNWKC
jgi:hypothetical protein